MDKHHTDFLPRDPAEALVEVKERLYARLAEMTEKRENAKRCRSYLTSAYTDETLFLINLLADMEKS